MCLSAFGAGEHAGQRVLAPPLAPVGIGVAAPQIDHQVSVDPHGDRCADLITRGEVRLKASRTAPKPAAHAPPMGMWSLNAPPGRRLSPESTAVRLASKVVRTIGAESKPPCN